MKLIFVRHADPDYEQDSLTPRGVNEAKALYERVSHWDIDHILISPYGRARMTAQYALGLPVGGEIPDVIERDGKKVPVEVADWTREFDEKKILRPDRDKPDKIPWDWIPRDLTRYGEFYDKDRWFLNPRMQDGGVPDYYKETCMALDALIRENGYERDGMLYLVKKENRRRIVFFTHFGVTCVFLSHLLNISPMQLWHGICICPTGVTSVTTEERREGIASFRTDYIGDWSHVAAAGLPFNTSARFAENFSAKDERFD